MICKRIGVMKPYLFVVGLLGAAATFCSWQLPVGPGIVISLILAGFLQSAILPLLFSFPMLLPEMIPNMRAAPAVSSPHFRCWARS